MAKPGPGGFKGLINWMKTFWTVSYKWDCVKSVSLFVIGIILARFVNSKSTE